MKRIYNRRTRINIERHEIKIIRIRNGVNLTFCEHCQSQTRSFTPGQIALFLQIPLDEVSGDIESGKFHLTKSDRNLALVCGNSLGG